VRVLEVLIAVVLGLGLILEASIVASVLLLLLLLLLIGHLRVVALGRWTLIRHLVAIHEWVIALSWRAHHARSSRVLDVDAGHLSLLGRATICRSSPVQALMANILEHTAGAGRANAIFTLLAHLPGALHLGLALLGVFCSVCAPFLGQASR